MIDCIMNGITEYCAYPCGSGPKGSKPFYCLNHVDFLGNNLLVEGCFFLDETPEKEMDFFVKDENGNYERIDSVVISHSCEKVFFKYERSIGKKECVAEFYYSVGKKMIPFPHVTLGQWCPFNYMESSYYYRKGFVATIDGNKIIACKIGWIRHLGYQEKYMRALKKKGKTDGVAKQSLRLRRLYNALSMFISPEKLCIVSDRYLTAGHKGVDLCYRIKEENKDVKVYFAVDESKRKELPLPAKNILIIGSEKYKRILLLAQTMVYSSFDSQETFFIEPTYIKDILAKKWYSLL